MKTVRLCVELNGNFCETDRNLAQGVEGCLRRYLEQYDRDSYDLIIHVTPMDSPNGSKH